MVLGLVIDAPDIGLTDDEARDAAWAPVALGTAIIINHERNTDEIHDDSQD